ncbi:hypothetical protein PG614_09470 [Riemerella anatipestifer]|nr:hypothetical protein [Riemerella anatipestifer]MDY3533960.1 hypothetical protein [Riemerella anatipestifer]MDY3536174.1 hypothetical protein [Riemerella anatipestifer]
MKTKTTKLSVLAFLGLGLVVYGQSGKVGVNVSSPRATLDVQPNATNSQGDAKTNEGILAPQLSKTRVASIEAPVEGTLVYVIDDATKTNGAISNYTGNDTKVAKITEKGYYYYNGIEWVKSSAETSGQLWNKTTSSADTYTYLIPANETNVDFGYKKTNPNVRALLLNMKNNNGTAVGGGLWLPNPNGVTPEYGFKKNFSSDILPLSLPASNTFWAPGYTFEETGIMINGSHTNTIASNIRNYRGVNSSITTNPDVVDLGDVMGVRASVDLGMETSSQSNSSNVSTVTTTTAKSIMGGAFGATSFSVGKVNTIRGSAIYSNSYQGGEVGRMNALNTSTKMKRGGKADVMEGITNEVYTQLADNGSYASSSVRAVAGLRNMVFINDNTTVTDGGASARFDVTFGNNTTAPSFAGLFYMLKMDGNAEVGRLYGSRLNTEIATTAKVTDMYGIYLDNVKAGADKNYAIYTNAGKVRFGDNVGIGVDTPAEKLEVAGNVKATGFIGSNAAIFPDYVFQKYYTGTSSLKADYSFKTLSQVEDFVKTNGHLPGYQSAEAIKKQGYIDLMATQLTNVEKIEELYLHSIEQDKALKAKDAKIAELEARLQKLETLLVK